MSNKHFQQFQHQQAMQQRQQEIMRPVQSWQRRDHQAQIQRHQDRVQQQHTNNVRHTNQQMQLAQQRRRSEQLQREQDLLRYNRNQYNARRQPQKPFRRSFLERILAFFGLD